MRYLYLFIIITIKKLKRNILIICSYFIEWCKKYSRSYFYNDYAMQFWIHFFCRLCMFNIFLIKSTFLSIFLLIFSLFRLSCRWFIVRLKTDIILLFRIFLQRFLLKYVLFKSFKELKISNFIKLYFLGTQIYNFAIYACHNNLLDGKYFK